MSLNKIQKQLDRLESEVFFNRPQLRRAFLMTDSKGRYLEMQVNRGEDIVDIVWQSSARVDNTELLNRLLEKIDNLDRPLVFVWLGTCEFTEKERGQISLRKNNSVNDVVLRLRNVKRDILQKNPSTEVVFLKCPIFSIVCSNNCDSFKADDKVLQEKIENLNLEISVLNSDTMNVPNFSMDLLKNTKRDQAARSNYIYKFDDFYTDGVHPIDILAELWLRKIQKLVCNNCF